MRDVRIDVLLAGAAVLVQPFGELDVATAAELEAAINGVEQTGESVIVLDLRGVDFIDSTGLRTVLALSMPRRRPGPEVAVVRGPDQVQRIFELTGTTDRVRFVDDPSEVIGNSVATGA
jgi:anti-sigma B factor antagonist